MTTPPAKAAATAQRSRLSIPEAMARLGWNENDLKEAIISGHIVPSTFVPGPVWPMPVGTNGRRKRTVPAIFVNDWMFAVGVRPVGPFDCEFDFLASAPDALKCNADVYTLAESGYVKARIRLADIMQSGAVDVEQIKNLESHLAETATTNLGSANFKALPFWQTDYDPVEMARKIEAELSGKGWGVNQRGRRAGKFPRTTLSAMIAKEINQAEAAANRTQSIGPRRVGDFLKLNGW